MATLLVISASNILCANLPPIQTELSSNKKRYILEFLAQSMSIYDLKIIVSNTDSFNLSNVASENPLAFLSAKATIIKNDRKIGSFFTQSNQQLQFSGFMDLKTRKAGFYFGAMGTMRTPVYGNIDWKICQPPWEAPVLRTGEIYKVIIDLNGLPEFLETFGHSYLELSRSADN